MPAIFVQTKSHSGEALRVTMKLSNAVRLALTPAPAFIVLRSAVQSTAANSRWYAVHFWTPLIERALKRAREASRDGIDDKLNRQSFSFTMTEADGRSDESLLAWMAATVKGVGQDYANAKKGLQPPPEIVGSVTLGPLASIEELVDHQLGLTPEIPARSISLSMRRFGVDLPFPLPIPSGPPLHFSMQAHPADHCDVFLTGPDHTKMEVRGDIFTPALPNLPKHEQKLRIKTPLFDIIWRLEGQISIKSDFDTDAKHTPVELAKFVRFLSWAGQGDFDVRVTVRDDPLVFGSASLAGNEYQEMHASLARQIDMLAELSSHLKVTELKISVADVLESEEVYDLYRFMNGTNMKLKMEIFEGQEAPQIVAGIASGAASVGEWIFAAIQHVPITRQDRDGTQIALEFGDPRLLQSYAFRADDDPAIERFEADFHRYINKPGILGMSNILSRFQPNAPYE
jgi:hypothetical protein